MEKLLDIHNHIYDPSFLVSYCECKRKCYYKYILGLTPKERSSAPNFGGLLHKGLAHFYQGNSPEECIALWNEIAVDLPPNELRTPAKGEEILREYFETHMEEPFTWDKALVESGFTLELDGFVLRGRLDLPITWGEAIYALDHKSTKVIGASYFQGFETSLQMGCYALATRTLMGRCNGCVINAIRVSPSTPEALRKRKLVSSQRHIVSKSEGQLDAVLSEVYKIVADFEERYARLQAGNDCFFKESPACSYFGGCEYRWICLHGDADKVIDTQFTRAKEPGVRYNEEEVKK